MTSPWRLRPLQASDVDAVLAIFNHYVAHSFAAYANVPLSRDAIQAMIASTEGCPAVAAENEQGRVVGFSFLRPYSTHQTFAGATRLTTFIAEGYTGQGLGAAFLEWIESEARAQGIRVILAHISSRNEGSLAFHQRHGYVPCGRFHDIGRKFGQAFDIVWLEKMLQPMVDA